MLYNIMRGPLFGRLALVAVSALLLSGCHSSDRFDQKPILVAAAADLGPAFEEIGREYEKTTGTKVTFSFGSTGTLAKQIENGAPMDLFAAANVAFIDDLQKKGLIIPDTKALYARGRITLWKHPDSKLQIDKLQDLTRPEVQKVGIAVPEHAPYGAAAREAMQTAGIWDQVKDKMVFAENVRMALQYAETGNTDVSVVALSLSMQSKGHWFLIPEELHKPLDQALAVIKDTRNEEKARRFASFINGPQGRPIMRKYGFTLPGETQ
ncbi:MAG TPA: molybdate ABC transporter substrate-binding protein [Pyrinomonadaceae bacterium]|nr:molybdate ABC transporter substrate-binding protein [Pyrinomonadaceae bacterium]